MSVKMFYLRFAFQAGSAAAGVGSSAISLACRSGLCCPAARGVQAKRCLGCGLGVLVLAPEAPALLVSVCQSLVCTLRFRTPCSGADAVLLTHFSLVLPNSRVVQSSGLRALPLYPHLASAPVLSLRGQGLKLYLASCTLISADVNPTLSAAH